MKGLAGEKVRWKGLRGPFLPVGVGAREVRHTATAPAKGPPAASVGAPAPRAASPENLARDAAQGAFAGSLGVPLWSGSAIAE